MRARPIFLFPLLLALAAFATYLVVPARIGRAHEAAIAEAERLAAALRDVPGAKLRPRKECNGDSVRRCTYVLREVRAVVGEVEAELRSVSGAQPRTKCDEFVSPEGLRSLDCTVRVETARGHGVIVLVDTRVRPSGKAEPGTKIRPMVARGTDITVTAV